MDVSSLKVAVISHAGIKQINRAVYRLAKESVGELRLFVPAALQLGSGKSIKAELPSAGDPEVIPLELSGRNPRTYFYPELTLQLAKFLPDVVLLENDPVSRLGFTLSVWCKRNRAKLICQSYENLRRDVKTTLRQRGWRALPANTTIRYLNNWMASRTDALLVVNHDSETIFKESGYPNVTMLPLGYDPEVFFKDEGDRSRYREIMGVSDGTVLIAYFGRMVEQKGVHLLIGALALITDLPWKLLLDHAHDEAEKYVSSIRGHIAACGMESRILYFHADHFEIAHYMRAADIAVAPSVTTPNFKEQYGRAVQEAMACGCVCVVSDSGHLKDLVREKDLVFPEGDIEALSRILRKLLVDRQWRSQCSHVLHERTVKNLTIAVQARQLVALLARLMSDK